MRPNWGSQGEIVFLRTYSRTKPNGDKESWKDTIARVATGNLSLVYGDKERWSPAVEHEYDRLLHFMERFAILPAGRHLWASGVSSRQYLFNCHHAGWAEKLSTHSEFNSLRLFEGGGVGSNFSSKYLAPYGLPRRHLTVHIVCDPSHPDYLEMDEAGVLSKEFSHEWEGAYAVEDTREGWAKAQVDLIDTFMTDSEVRHGDRVYDVTRVRHKGTPLRSSGGYASGPQPFAVMMRKVARTMNSTTPGGPTHLKPVEAMLLDHYAAEAVVAGGNRRSARMSMCHWLDPFIFEFINCKADSGEHWTTNISVEVDDHFIEALGDESHKDRAHAAAVHAAVVAGMLTNGEPGYWNSTLSNVGEVGTVTCTNPCGEVPLEEFENCNLGHVNLDAFAPTLKNGPHDILGLIEAHRLMTRFLIRATWGDSNDPKSREVLARNRRIGVGHFGVQGFWAKKGLRYSEVPKQAKAKKFLTELYDVVRKEARDYAFELRIPEPIKVTTVAPTGSIAKLPGVTEGIHPVYARFFERRVRFSKTSPTERDMVLEASAAGFTVEDDACDASGNTAIVVYPTKEKLVAEVEALGYNANVVESADEIDVRDMLSFQAMYQESWADLAVSYTVNIPEGKYEADELGAVIAEFLPRLKGTTVMVDGTRAQAPYTRITKAQFAAYTVTRIEDSTDEECASGACPVR